METWRLKPPETASDWATSPVVAAVAVAAVAVAVVAAAAVAAVFL